MAYTKNPTWVNEEDGSTTYITAAKLNNLETQYDQAATTAASLAANAASGAVTSANAFTSSAVSVLQSHTPSIIILTPTGGDDSGIVQAAVTAATSFGVKGVRLEGAFKIATKITLNATIPITLEMAPGGSMVATATMTTMIEKPSGAWSGAKFVNLNLDGAMLADRCVDIEQSHLLNIDGGLWKNVNVCVADFGKGGGQVYETTWKSTRVVGIDNDRGGATPAAMPAYGYRFGTNTTDNLVSGVVVKNALATVTDNGASNLHFGVHVFGYPVATTPGGTDYSPTVGFDITGANIKLHSIYADTQNIGVRVAGLNTQIHNAEFFWLSTWKPAGTVYGVRVIAAGLATSILGCNFHIASGATYTGIACQTDSGSFNTSFIGNKANGPAFGPNVYIFNSGNDFDIALANHWTEGRLPDITRSPTQMGNTIVTGAAATQRSMALATAGQKRFEFRLNSNAETGSNAGSSFQFADYNDAGTTQIRNYITIDRAVGILNWFRSHIFGYTTINLATNGAVTIDASAGNDQVVFLAANATSTTITNAVAGIKLSITYSQDITGGRTYAWPTNCRFGTGGAPSDTTSGKRTTVTFMYSSSLWWEVARAVAVG